MPPHEIEKVASMGGEAWPAFFTHWSLTVHPPLSLGSWFFWNFSVSSLSSKRSSRRTAMGAIRGSIPCHCYAQVYGAGAWQDIDNLPMGYSHVDYALRFCGQRRVTRSTLVALSNARVSSPDPVFINTGLSIPICACA